ncbi:hypothetical protein [Streptomyces sp. NPDC056242]|uniref:hypothetical protein n=1 Tax=Streptomyces sp. NPDC056242 TaxID=3345760 RepID=UPI0035DD5E48
MPKFRLSISRDELFANTDPKVLEGHETTYQASRGGSFPKKDQPVPGARKTRREG